MKATRCSHWIGISVAGYGLLLAAAGAWLVTAGGSYYYILAGIGTICAGVMLGRNPPVACTIYAAVLGGTGIWAVAEAGLAPWLIAPRLGAPLVVGIVLLSPWIISLRRRHKRLSLGIGAVAMVAAGILVTWLNADLLALETDFVAKDRETDWRHFAGENDGQRFADIQQITPDNVGQLRLAWMFRTGEDPMERENPRNLPSFQATPIKIGQSLYFCTPRNQVIAVDANTGKERWRHDPHTNVQGDSYLLACRGVSYYESPHALGQCKRRIIAATLDARLLALDADTGKPCAGFGRNGTVSLLENLGETLPGHYSVTSAPLIAGGAIIIGAQVFDNQSVDMPSGVIRAYEAETGRQRWAFDTGADVSDRAGVPAPDTIYTRGSPNAWAPFSADEALGLVYVPTGNPSPDFYGPQRSAAMERNGSAILALDLMTGKRSWSFQTVHHDLWDYDVAAQPVLLDFPTANGPVPALIQPTKRGDLFVLDRRAGTPLTRVEERPVPVGGVDPHVSRTQPMSLEMPFLGPEPRTEASTWGVTPFDQIWCRVRFLNADYAGPFTPPSPRVTLQSPNQTGASSWGRVSIDRAKGILVANTVNLDALVRLVPRDEVQKMADQGRPLHNKQAGTPYGVSIAQFMSPLGIPCIAPPWGEIRAIDLKSRTTIWRKPFGTIRDRLPVPLALPLGMPSVGGPLTTAGGVTFIGAADDGYFRAYQTQTGRELWRVRLPAAAQAAPMTYVSENGRQYVVIAAGGDLRLGTRMGDYLLAFALPNERNARGE